MLPLAEAWDLRSAGSNPCRTVRRYKERKRERFLSPDETRRLGEVLDQAEAEGGASVYAVAAIRLLMLTGCRLNEVLSLRWDDADRTAGELRIRDGKTGPRSVPLTPTVREVLAAIPRVPGNPWVIVSRQSGRPPSIDHPRALVSASIAGRSRRCTNPRFQTQLCEPRPGSRCKPHDDRPAPWPHEGVDHCSLRPSGARDGEGVGGQGGWKHRCARPGAIRDQPP